MQNISSRNKGLITGAVMILFSVCIYLVKKDFENSLQYITYAMYVSGILWALLSFKKETGGTANFKQYFSEGFKCFIVVSLLMVLFTLVFILMHPEMKDQMAAARRAELATMKDITPLDIENRIAMEKKAFLPSLLISAVFWYLAIGALISATAGAFLSVQKKN
jgi:hypothetical protein